MYTIGNTTLVTVEDITTQEILDESTKASPSFYVAAVINADQYKDGYRMQYSLGAGDKTTDVYGHTFRNRRIEESTLFFFRVFSISSKPQVSPQMCSIDNNFTCYDCYREKFQPQQVCKH